MAFGEPNSATTLSLKYRPGINKRLLASNSESIFSFGDFEIQRTMGPAVLTGNTSQLSFGSFSTLQSLRADNFAVDEYVTSVKESELNLNPEDPKSHAYFSSFYIEVGNAINNIIDNYPYAILAWNSGTTNIFNYSEVVDNSSGTTFSTFNLYLSALTNQGEIIINSGNTLDKLSLVNNTDKFSIQLSGSSTIHKIISYSFSAEQLTFIIEGSLLTVPLPTSVSPLYIRPTPERLSDYNENLSSLESQLLGTGDLLIPNVESAKDISYIENFAWPRTIDGFAPDSFGSDFDTFQEDILAAAEKIDEEKTNIFLKTIIPENYLQFDTDNSIYRTIIQTYAHEFDKLKKYVDAIAYAHSINYNDKESVPGKFLVKLSNLLGWKLSNSFSELDLFDYLTSDADGEQNTYSYFNLEIWKRILVNIVWLYKRKGTRDALMFIFKILGAPECLINFNEFVYDVERVVHVPSSGLLGTLQAQSISLSHAPITFATPSHLTPIPHIVPSMITMNLSPQPLTPGNILTASQITPLVVTLPSPANDKSDAYGFIDYTKSQVPFQWGGEDRGNGQEYINQWRPEFNPKKRADNIKVQTGNTDINIGTKSIMNTKEVDIFFTPALAVECNVFSFYKEACSCWNWGSTCTSFTGLTVPYEYLNFSCAAASPTNITAMTLNQYIDYVFTNAVNPRNRKTYLKGNNTWHYPELKNIYLNYYYATYPEGNHLTIGKLDAYLNLIGVHLGEYIQQLIPATTIVNGDGSITYKNPLFHRQRFVYKEGISEGSMFQTHFPADLSPVVTPNQVSMNIVDTTECEVSPYTTGLSVITPPENMTVSPFVINSSVPQVYSCTNSVFSITMTVNENNINTTIPGWNVDLGTSDSSSSQQFSSQIIT